MKRADERELEVVAKTRHDSQNRLQQAYRCVWQWAIRNEAAQKENRDEPDRDVCESVEPTAGTRQDD